MRNPIRLLVGLALLAGATPAMAQEAGSIRLFVSGGLSTSPASYDSFRPVEYDPGIQFGGGLAIQLNDLFSLRGDIATGSNSGFEGAPISEDIEFDRTYYGVSLEASRAYGSLMPFLYAGGGYVDIERAGASYGYSFIEAAAEAGLGLRVPLGGSGVEAFGQGSVWAYPNTSTGETRFDPMLNIGVGYTLPF